MSSPSTNRSFPDQTSLAAVAPDALRCRKLRLGYDYWRLLRGTRRFPAREDIHPRAIAGVLSNMVLIKVIGGGADYQFRIVGDHAGLGYSVPLKNRLLSEVGRDLPRAAAHWRAAFDRVVTSGEPHALRVTVGRDAGDTNFTEAEVVFLPLGQSDADVEFVVNFVEHVLKF